MSENSEVIFLRGWNVNMRPLLRSDIPLLLRWINDPETRHYLLAIYPMMEIEEENWVNRAHEKKPNDVSLMITVKEKPIGTMGLHRINFVDRTARTGALIGDQENRGKGYGTEAKMLLLNYAFSTLNLRKICTSVLAPNLQSLQYCIKSGYEKEGVLKQQIFRDGEYVDEILLCVFRDEWMSRWKQYKIERDNQR